TAPAPPADPEDSRWPTGRRSGAVAAVDVELLAGDEPRPRRGQEADRLGDVPCRTEAAQRDVVPGDVPRALVEIAGADEPLGHAVGEHPWSHAVDADAEAPLLGREGIDQLLDRALRP